MVRVLPMLAGVPALCSALAAQQFERETILGRGPGPSDMVTADFDVDGVLDLVVQTSSPPTSGLEVLSRAGNGRWTSRSGFPLGANGRFGLIAAELDGDGRPELLAMAAWMPTSSLQITSFDDRLRPQLRPAVTLPFSGQLAWLRGDGDPRPDAFVLDASLGRVAFLRHLGSGTFAPPVVSTFSLPTSGVELRMADFDGDDIGDLAAVVRNPAAPGPRIELSLGDGTGGFLPPVTTALPPVGNSAPPLAADLDRDGRTDLVVEDRVLLAAGAGTFVLLPAVLAGPARAAGDFDGDGRTDVLAAFPFSVVPLLQQANGAFVAGGPAIPVGSFTEPFVVDMDQDGRLDIVGLHTATNGPEIAFLARGVQPHTPPHVWPYGAGTPGCRGQIALSANADPLVGATGFAITATNAPEFAPGVLLATAYQVPLPYSTDVFGLGVLTHIPPFALQVLSFASDRHGQACLPTPVPGSTNAWQLQGLWLAPFGDGACSESPLGFVASNALQLWSH